MKTTYRKSVAGGLLACALLVSFVARGDEPGGNPLQQVVNGVEIYLGVAPAEMVASYPSRHPERRMHGGAGNGGYHVLVALFDAATGKRITDAEVSARLYSPAVSYPATRLEPMIIADVQNYGNYLNMVSGGSYRIDVLIRRAGTPEPIRASFNWSTR